MNRKNSRGASVIVGTLLLASGLALSGQGTTSAASNEVSTIDGQTFDSAVKMETGSVLFQQGNLTVSVGQADPPSMPSEFAQVAAEAAGLSDFNDNDFSDMYYDAAAKRVMLTPTTPTGQELAQKFASGFPQQVGVAPGAFSHVEMKDGGRALIAADDFLSKSARELGVSAGSHGIYIKVNGMPDNLGALAEAANKLGFSVDVILDKDVVNEGRLDEDRRHDSDPYSGGLGFLIADDGTTWDSECSGAFGYRESGADYMLTAGHCYPNNLSEDRMYMLSSGSTWNSPALGVWAGSWLGRSATNYQNGVYNSIQVNGSYHGDIALVSLTAKSHGAGNRIWDGGASTTSKTDVYDRIAPYVNLFICKGGATSGSSCGTLTVKATNIDWQTSGQWLREVDRAHAGTASECSSLGDSGGSIYAYRTASTVDAVGVISGHVPLGGGDCSEYFTGAEEAVQAWGGDVRQTG